VFIYSFGNFLFTLGIHQTVVNGVILEPLLLANMNENMLAFANREVIPHLFPHLVCLAEQEVPFLFYWLLFFWKIKSNQRC